MLETIPAIVIQINDPTNAMAPIQIAIAPLIKVHSRQSGAPLKSGVTSMTIANPKTKHPSAMYNNNQYGRLKFISARSGLTKKAEPRRTDGSRKTKAGNSRRWLRRLVRHHGVFNFGFNLILTPPDVISPYWSGMAIISLGAPNGYTVPSELVS